MRDRGAMQPMQEGQPRQGGQPKGTESAAHCCIFPQSTMPPGADARKPCSGTAQVGAQAAPARTRHDAVDVRLAAPADHAPAGALVQVQQVVVHPKPDQRAHREVQHLRRGLRATTTVEEDTANSCGAGTPEQNQEPEQHGHTSSWFRCCRFLGLGAAGVPDRPHAQPEPAGGGKECPDAAAEHAWRGWAGLRQPHALHPHPRAPAPCVSQHPPARWARSTPRRTWGPRSGRGSRPSSRAATGTGRASYAQTAGDGGAGRRMGGIAKSEREGSAVRRCPVTALR